MIAFALSPSFEFAVPGKPQPKGSIRAVPHKHSGKILMLGANPKSRTHEKEIAMHARAAGVTLAEPDVAVTVEIMFALARPKKHFRRSGLLHEDSPSYPTAKPDVDKLIRCVLDGLTGVAYRDDSQVVRVDASKVYGDSTWTWVRVRHGGTT